MIITESGFGNQTEAFIEDRYKSGINVIFSNENNKGKTLVVQGLMYALGNDPIFPSGFDYKGFYFYVHFEINGIKWKILRYANSFIIKNDSYEISTDSVSELKRIIKKNIFDIPVYLKDDREKIADPALLYQVFFLPQDRRDTSGVIGGGYYNKTDFINMILAMSGEIPKQTLSDEEEQRITNEIQSLKESLRGQSKLFKFAKKNPRIAEYFVSESDKNSYDSYKNRMQVLIDRMSENKKRRAREVSLKLKMQNLLKELYSLNRELTVGALECGDCGSDKVVYKQKELIFDVSNDFIRDSIIKRINSELELKDEILAEITHEIDQDQQKVEDEMEQIPVDIRQLMLHFEDVISDVRIDRKMRETQGIINEKLQKLKESKSAKLKSRKIGRDIITRIIQRMMELYRAMDPDGTLAFDGLFSKSGAVYSGSEGMEYYLSRLIAIKIELNHDFPIVIDSFRDGELSTAKENTALSLLKNVGCQVIVTSTLKSSEYEIKRYSSAYNINGIDYSGNPNSHILDTAKLSDFAERLKQFGINLAGDKPPVNKDPA